MSTLIIKNVDSEFVSAFRAMAKSIGAKFSVQNKEKKPSKKLLKAVKQAKNGEVESFKDFDEFKRSMLGEIRD